MYLCWEIGAIDLMITIDDVSGWFIWTQNWNSGMEPINLTIPWGRWWCFFILTLVSFVGAGKPYTVYLCNMEILFCACYSLNHMCSWAVLDKFSPLTSFVLITQRSQFLYQSPFISTYLYIFQVAVRSIVYFSVVDVCFAEILGLQYFPRVASDSLQNLDAVARFWLKNTWNLGCGLCRVSVIRIM